MYRCICGRMSVAVDVKGSQNLLGLHVTPVGIDFASRSSRLGPLSVDPSRLQRCDLTLCRLPREPLVQPNVPNRRPLLGAKRLYETTPV